MKMQEWEKDCLSRQDESPQPGKPTYPLPRGHFRYPSTNCSGKKPPAQLRPRRYALQAPQPGQLTHHRAFNQLAGSLNPFKLSNQAKILGHKH